MANTRLTADNRLLEETDSGDFVVLRNNKWVVGVERSSFYRDLTRSVYLNGEKSEGVISTALDFPSIGSLERMEGEGAIDKYFLEIFFAQECPIQQ